MGGDERHAFGPVCEPLPSGEVACFTVADDGTEQLLTCRPTMVRDAMRGTRSCLNCGQKRVGVLASVPVRHPSVRSWRRRHARVFALRARVQGAHEHIGPR